jgi:hypothetical protein
MLVEVNFLFSSLNTPDCNMEKKSKYSNLSLSAYAFGYGCGFVKDNRPEAKDLQNFTLSNLKDLTLNYNLGGIEIPVDKYFKEKKVEEFEKYITDLNNSGLRLIYAFENFEFNFFSKIAHLIKFKYGNFIRVKISNFYGGNRFKQRIYQEDIRKFRLEFKKCIDIIDQYKIKVLIENHQDVTLNDIFDLIDEFGSDRIGINWDTGNSFPTGETVESFLNKSINIIENVHLKDYQIQLTKGGYVMHRCELGKGVIDFYYLINRLFKNNSNLPYTIELGAMNGREALVNNDLYWSYTKGVTNSEKLNLLNYINQKGKNFSSFPTLWEQNAHPDKIIESEHLEVVNSIKYIKNIIKNIYENNE